MTLTPEQLADLERLEAAATQGEWSAFVSAISSGYGGIETHDQAFRDEGEESVLPTSSAKEDDLLFIAAIRNAAKPLIEEVKRLREENERMAERLEINHVFKTAPGGGWERIDLPKEKWLSEDFDGIACRDLTIKGLDEEDPKP